VDWRWRCHRLQLLMAARMTTTERQLDTADLTERVKGMYQEVALHPDHEFHFESA